MYVRGVVTGALLGLIVGVAGCGGSGDASVEERQTERGTAGDETSREPNDGAQITGLMGTIRADQVQNALDPRMPRFQRCFADRMRQVELLAGDIRMAFRIHTDGTVAWVYPQQSSIGDRDTERCILEIARGTRFPRPRGGEAEFGWGFGLDAASDIRPPLTWGEEQLGRRAEDVPALARECRAQGPFAITAYVEPGGTVLTAGGTTPNAESDEALECILTGIRSWTLPDPGSYPAKITFGVR